MTMVQNNDNYLIDVVDLQKIFTIDGRQVEVLKDINLHFKDGQFVCIVGASGCGKSTLLRIIAGLETVTAGYVSLDGKEITGPSASCGMIFQESRLFPWLTVEKNVEFGLPRSIGKKERKNLAKSHIDLVGLTGFEKALPNQLSGGMQQRASIARSLVTDPKVLLLDEPFGALDAMTRIGMQNEILRIWKAKKKTMVLVTHDIDEAIFLGDIVIVISSRPGEIKRIIRIELPRPRGRNNEDFLKYKKEIYNEFFEETSYDIEYML
jgi:sulfonate transport system ATP-binding protein